MTRLSLFHRIAAVLSSALLLQLSLVSSGTLCRMHGDQSMAGVMDAPAAGRTTHASQTSAQAHASNAGTMGEASSEMPSGPCDTTGMSKSCDSPWAPAGCASMTSCVTAVSALASLSPSASEQSAVAVYAAASADMPPGPAYAPELPPPRA